MISTESYNSKETCKPTMLLGKERNILRWDNIIVGNKEDINHNCKKDCTYRPVCIKYLKREIADLFDNNYNGEK